MSTAAREIKPAKGLNIHQRINEVRKKVWYAKKDKDVAGQGYKAVTHDAVTALVRNHLIDQGVLIVPRLIDSGVTDTGTTTKNGVPIIRYEARFEIDFVNCDDAADKLTVVNEAHANDHGDKAPGKAVSYATKYAILKLFNIETGEDDESRSEPWGGGELISPEQAKELKDLLEETDSDVKAFLRWAKVSSVEAIPAKAFNAVKAQIEAKKK